MRKCKICGIEKDLGAFRTRQIWKSHTCKLCYAAQYRTGKKNTGRFIKGYKNPPEWIEKREKTKREKTPIGKKEEKPLKAEGRTSLKCNRWAKQVKERDGHICQECRSEQDLTAHHIIKWKDDSEKRFSLENGITLCRSCHSRVERLLEAKQRREVKDRLKD